MARTLCRKLALATLLLCAVYAGTQEPVPAPGSAGDAPVASAKTKAVKSVKRSALIDVNHATVEELETLPGIAEAFALKIVKNRPYANKTQLQSKGVISAATYAKIKSLIVAKQ